MIQSQNLKLSIRLSLSREKSWLKIPPLLSLAYSFTVRLFRFWCDYFIINEFVSKVTILIWSRLKARHVVHIKLNNSSLYLSLKRRESKKTTTKILAILLMKNSCNDCNQSFLSLNPIRLVTIKSAIYHHVFNKYWILTLYLVQFYLLFV